MSNENDLGAIIGKLTENPDVMRKLMGIANGIMGEQEQHQKKCCESEQECCHEQNKCPPPIRHKDNDIENLSRLLCALKPYTNEAKREKIDSIVKLLNLISLAEKSGFLKELM